MFIQYLSDYIKESVPATKKIPHVYDAFMTGYGDKAEVDEFCIRHMPTSSPAPYRAGVTSVAQYQLLVRMSSQKNALQVIHDVRNLFYLTDIKQFNDFAVSSYSADKGISEAIALKLTTEPQLVDITDKRRYIYSLTISAEYTEDQQLLTGKWGKN
ncbi:hypothetical protein [Bacillus paranthracis]|uniref:hypothetical protein n=1 Tax=Bacillus paranthracis TaxID=2026186 RepID=UPI003D653D3F